MNYRKPKQLLELTNYVEVDGQMKENRGLIVLCEDGTMWSPERKGNSLDWTEIPGIPA